MKKLFIAAMMAVATIVAPQASTAATPKADRATISSEISSGRYATAFEKFKSGSPMSVEDATVVYYGSALQPGFNATASVADILNTFNAGQTDKAFRMCEKVLASDPTNLAVLFKAYASAMASNDAAIKSQATAMQNRILAVCDAIFASGSGVTDSSPYVVIRPADIDEFVVKYIQPEKVIGRAKIGSLEAAKVKLDPTRDDVILYFKQGL